MNSKNEIPTNCRTCSDEVKEIQKILLRHHIISKIEWENLDDIFLILLLVILVGILSLMDLKNTAGTLASITAGAIATYLKNKR